VLTEDDAKELMKSGHKLPSDLPGHAQEFETAFALAAFPENVRTDMWTDQTDPTPAMATAEKGREFIDRTVDRVSDFVTDMIEGRRVAEIPPYFP
jgi:creatinine amidohydrolase/Fe(II)-dependent formamide hydrolase-like protein